MCQTDHQPDIEIAIPSQVGYEKVARATIGAFARSAGFGSAQVADLQTVLCEACLCAIEYGASEHAARTVRVMCYAAADELRVTVCDAGELTHPATPRQTLGLALIAALTEARGYAPCSDGGTQFWFTLRRQAARST